MNDQAGNLFQHSVRAPRLSNGIFNSREGSIREHCMLDCYMSYLCSTVFTVRENGCQCGPPHFLNTSTSRRGAFGTQKNLGVDIWLCAITATQFIGSIVTQEICIFGICVELRDPEVEHLIAVRAAEINECLKLKVIP